MRASLSLLLLVLVLVAGTLVAGAVVVGHARRALDSAAGCRCPKPCPCCPACPGKEIP